MYLRYQINSNRSPVIAFTNCPFTQASTVLTIPHKPFMAGGYQKKRLNMKLPGRRGKGRPQRRFNRCIEGGNVGVTEERSAVATSKGSSQKKSWLPITDSIRRQINVHLTNSAEKRDLCLIIRISLFYILVPFWLLYCSVSVIFCV